MKTPINIFQQVVYRMCTGKLSLLHKELKLHKLKLQVEKLNTLIWLQMQRYTLAISYAVHYQQQLKNLQFIPLNVMQSVIMLKQCQVGMTQIKDYPFLKLKFTIMVIIGNASFGLVLNFMLFNIIQNIHSNLVNADSQMVQCSQLGILSTRVE